MNLTRTFFFWAVFTCALAISTFAAPRAALAGWPSPEKVIDIVGPIAGINSDQIEFAKFAIKKPACASTVVSYTVAQDYSLVAFIAALKVSKFQSLPQLPKMSGGQCKSYNPVQQAYIFVDSLGDRFLGASHATALRGLLSEQIEEGKSTLDAKIASIPYVGTVLTNWDCGCDAAFMTNFKDEKIVDQKLGDIIFIANAVKSADFVSALERMVTSLGPKAACDLGAQWTGVSSVPLVSDIAASACSGVAGKAVEWVISGAGATAEALGIVGGPHIPPEEYYKNMFMPEIGKHGYGELAGILYKKCYSYFEASNMAASTAKKVCAGMHARYLGESEGKVQNEAFYKEWPSYNNNVFGPVAEKAVLMTDGEFEGVVSSALAACENYFGQKYPKILLYRNTYKPAGDPDEKTLCPSSGLYKKRRDAQSALLGQVAKKLEPLCKWGSVKNSLVCEDAAMPSCFSELGDVCVKASDGGMQRPCCLLGSGMDAATKWNSDFAKSMASGVGGPFCSTEKSDPLAVTCVTDAIYQRCLKGYKGTLPPDCAATEKHPAGASKTLCCRLNTAGLDKIPGAKEVQAFVKTQNLQSKGSCGIGGMQKGLSFDPRIAHCVKGAALEACEKAFPSACAPSGAGGFVSAPCCDLSVFGGSVETSSARPYSTKDRSAEDLALAASAVVKSKGACVYAKGPARGEEDKFRLVCANEAALKQCVADIGRPAQTPCNKKLSSNGWVTSPCCERSMDSLTGQVDKNAGQDIKAPSGKDMGVGGLGTTGTTGTRNMGTRNLGAPTGGAATSTGARTMPPSPAPRSGLGGGAAGTGGRTLSPSPAPSPLSAPVKPRAGATEEETGVAKRALDPYKP